MNSDDNKLIHIIASLSSPRQFANPLLCYADAVEVRLDMITEPVGNLIFDLKQRMRCPIVLTLRSSDEGGAYAGKSDGYLEVLKNHIKYADYVDLEEKFSNLSSFVHENNAKVIASRHMNEMPDPAGLEKLARTLRSFGDIPKIAVQPKSRDDILTLLSFTNKESREGEVIVSVTGDVSRYARPLLALFGSLYTYCYIDSPTSPGQYSIKEMKELSLLLTPGEIDTWFEGRPVRSGNKSALLNNLRQ